MTPSDEIVESLVEVLPALASIGARSFASWVRSTRESRGLSVKELAEQAGVSLPTVYNIEAGRIRNPQGATRQRIERALGERVPVDTAAATSRASKVEGLGELHDFDPHDQSDWPAEPGIYVFYDVSKRPIYVGQGGDMRSRIRAHYDKFWFKKPIVDEGMFIRVADESLRKQIETLLIKFLRSNAVINQQNVDR